MKIEKTIWIKIIIIAVIAVLSATVVAQKAGSPDSRLSKACIQQLDKQRGNSEALAASAVGLSVAIGLLPGDVGSGIADKLVDVSGYLLVVLCAIFLEKYMLTLFGLLAFRFLIPIGCALLICALFFEGFWKKLGIRLIIYGLVIYLLVPTSLFVSTKIQDIYQDSYEDTIEMAKESTDKVNESIESDSSESENIIEKAKETLSNAVTYLTGHVKEALDSAKKTLNRMLEYVAVLIVTSCLIPILVLVLLVSLSNAILGTSPELKPVHLRRPMTKKKEE